MLRLGEVVADLEERIGGNCCFLDDVLGPSPAVVSPSDVMIVIQCFSSAEVSQCSDSSFQNVKI